MHNQTILSHPRYAASDCIAFAKSLLEQAGLDSAFAKCVAETLVEADLMGHTTHGLQLLNPYLREIEKGLMTKSGEPITIQDRGSSISWNGQYLPGPWLVHQALDVSLERIKKHPVVTMTIQKSHHIACLACFLERATHQNVMILLASSDPANKTVAPYGSIEGIYSPDPIAVGIPTDGDAIWMDISMSATANGVVLQKHKNGERLPAPWLLDAQGEPTDDTNTFFEDPPATMMPIGGLDNGYKGFALGLMIEALTNALSGYGRSDDLDRWTSSVFLQLIDIDAFGGQSNFIKETSYLAKTSKNAKTVNGSPPVRLPGERARALRKRQLENGLFLYPTIKPSLEKDLEKYNIAFPKEL